MSFKDQRPVLAAQNKCNASKVFKNKTAPEIVS